MQVKRKKGRILKLLGKSILGLLLFLFGLILVVHIPFVQTYLSKQLPGYLSKRIGAKVELQKIGFSILGCAQVQGLKVWDPNDNMILSIDTLDIRTNFLDVLSGDYFLQQVKLNGFYGRLAQEENDELNIQFIIEAFTGDKKQTASSVDLDIWCDKIILDDIDFAFLSRGSQIEVATRFKSFHGTQASFGSDPMMLYMDSVQILEHHLDILTSSQYVSEEQLEKQAEINSLSLNLDIGIGIEVDALSLDDNHMSIHRDKKSQPQKFDPEHIVVQKVALRATDLLLHKDTLNFNLLSLSADLPGLRVDSVKAAATMNHQQFDIEDVFVQFEQSHISADLKTRLEQDESSTPVITLRADGQLAKEHMAYFLPDSLEQLIQDWTELTFAINAQPRLSGVESVDLRLSTKNSSVALAGDVAAFLDFEKISWNDLSIQSAIGSDFRNLIYGLAGETNLPSGDIHLRLMSSGHLKSFGVNGDISSSLGLIRIDGDLSPNNNEVSLDMQISSPDLSIGDYLNLDWLGPADLSVTVKGSVGEYQNLHINGGITSVDISNQTIRHWQIESSLIRDSLALDVMIRDSSFKSAILVDGNLGEPMKFSSALQLDRFSLGKLIKADSVLTVSGDFKANTSIGSSAIDIEVFGTDFILANHLSEYLIDTLNGEALVSKDSSFIQYQGSDGFIDLKANFDLRETKEVIAILSQQILPGRDTVATRPSSRVMAIEASLFDPGMLILAGFAVDSFSSIRLSGLWEEDNHSLNLKANTGKIAGFGFSYDTLAISMEAVGTDITSNVTSNNLRYKAIELGDLDFVILTEQDTSRSSLSLTYDSIQVLNLDTRMVVREKDFAISPERLIFYNKDYHIKTNAPFQVSSDNVIVDELLLSLGEMQITLDGDFNEYDLELKNLDLTNLDPVLFPDSVVIRDGLLNASMAYVKGEQLNLDAQIDNLVLLESTPFSVSLKSETKGEDIPFDFLLTNSGSTIRTIGTYDISRKDIMAELALDIDSMETFRFFYQKYLEDITGSLNGEAQISGSLEKPNFDGLLVFRDNTFSTKNPKLTFRVNEDSVRFSSEGLILDDFIIYDNLSNPLVVSGNITNNNYTSIAYDLNIQTDRYALINRPVDAPENLKGILVLGTHINLKGSENDTYVNADIRILDDTDLVLELPKRENQLLKTEGIIEFVEPSMLLDTIIEVQQVSMYDSIIASLPDFNLTSTVIVEENAGLTILIDPQSGDYFKVTGKAKLFLDYDRTGNPVLNGEFQAIDGVYSLSFYDLVKKDFKLVKGSSIAWAGAPDDGVLDIHAMYSIQSNSIGLVGHEIGENEKSVYKKSLDYSVSINILGTIKHPEVSFSLDLPEEDKITYPALANKLSRLKQPEFQSELNKQVFGLLVLGSFIPEASGAGNGQSDMATTALYNSVNGLLTGQLNKFANQYIKGVDIDVGIQSYSDYATNGGKTQTSMDFHVSKSLLNERLVFEVGGDFDIGADQSGANTGKGYRGDMAIIYDLTGNGDKKLKFFNNESYDIIYQEIRNTGIALIFIREFDKGEIKNKKKK